MKLSVVARSKMKEETICTLIAKNGTKLNLLRVGSDFLPFPVYLVRRNRREIFKSYEKIDALKFFRMEVYLILSDLQELF